jgi:lipoprotein-anchoring transpeptidase ErfK/SrfK
VRLGVAVLGVALAGFAGVLVWGGAPERPTRSTPEATETATATAHRTDGTAATGPSAREVSWVAEALVDPIAIFDDPADAVPARHLAAADAVTVPEQTPMVFLVRDRDRAGSGWLEVYLPVRPNGSSGWVRTRDVSLTEHRYRIEVSLSARELRVFDDGRLILAHAVGIGRRDRPTPGGVYFIKELLQPPDPDGVYGTFAYGLSGFSNVLETFAGGQGVVGIHGTNDPSSIGQETSAGCIRLPNDVIEKLVTFLPLGTPVEILE